MATQEREGKKKLLPELHVFNVTTFTVWYHSARPIRRVRFGAAASARADSALADSVLADSAPDICFQSFLSVTSII